MVDLLKRHKKIIIVAFLLSFSYLLFSVNIDRRKPLRWYERALVAIVSPVQKLVTGTVEKFANTWSHYIYLVHTTQENENLRREKAELEFKLAEYVEAALENERLRKLLLFQDRIKAPTISAEIVALDLSSQFKMVRINRGQKSGIEMGMPVLGDGGVVGQIFRVTGNYSDVLLGTDRNSNIDAVVQRSRAQGIIEGAGRKSFSMSFKYLSRVDDVKEGDLVITSGLDGVFPAGLSIGFVTAIDRPEVGIFQGAKVQPTVDFAKIREVMVVLKQNRPDLPGLVKRGSHG